MLQLTPVYLEYWYGWYLVKDEGGQKPIALYDRLQGLIGLIQPARQLYSNQHLLTLQQPLNLKTIETTSVLEFYFPSLVFC